MNRSDATIVILCGGLGTRLRSVLADRPKPMALIDGRPFLDLPVEQAVSQGFRRLVFCTGHQGHWIAEHFSHRTDIEAVISHETAPLGTAGALRACRRHLNSSTVLVLNGDSFCAIDLVAFLAEHRRRQAAATVAVVAADGRSDGGGIALDADSRIMNFHEKTSGAYLNAGIYAFERPTLDRIPALQPCSLEYDVFPALVGQGLYASVQQALVHDIGTPARLSAFQAQYSTSHNAYTEALQGGDQ
ncbi:MAG: NTP transferase domain-containing protein [Nitrospira sp.]|nr:NTP transferase domain-containing protein [Nitrospira sp.]